MSDCSATDTIPIILHAHLILIPPYKIAAIITNSFQITEMKFRDVTNLLKRTELISGRDRTWSQIYLIPKPRVQARL